MSDQRYAIGVDFGGTRIKLGLVDSSGRVLGRGLRPTPRDEGRDGILAAIAASVDAMIREAGPDAEILGVGLGTPGPLDAAAERVLFAPNVPGWVDLPLKRLLEDRLGRAVRLENDANAAALGEYWAGAGRGVVSIIFLGLGTGVGGGIVLEGRLWRGAHGAGAELGHVTLDPDGPPCGCGNRGCLETYAAAPAIVRYATAAIDAGHAPRLASWVLAGEPLTAELVSRAAGEGEPAAADAYAQAGRWLGIAVGSFINIFDPDKIVIGGGVAGSLDLILPALREETRRRSFKVIHDQVAIVPAELGDDAGVVGAAAPYFLDRR